MKCVAAAAAPHSRRRRRTQPKRLCLFLSRPVCVFFPFHLPLRFTTRCLGFYVHALARFTGGSHCERGLRVCACAPVRATAAPMHLTQDFRGKYMENNGARVITWRAGLQTSRHVAHCANLVTSSPLFLHSLPPPDPDYPEHWELEFRGCLGNIQCCEEWG